MTYQNRFLIQACLLLASVGVSFAQNYERIEPKTPQASLPRQEEEQTAQPERSVTLEEENAKVFVQKLKGITLSSPEKEDVSQAAEGIRVLGLSVLQNSDFKDQLNIYLNSPASMKTVMAITEKIYAFYQSQGQPLVRVRVPEQKLSDGVLWMVVQEAKLGEVKVEGNNWVSSQELLDHAAWEEGALKRGDSIQEAQLQTNVQWINKNSPLRNVQTVYAPGKEDGTTDVILKVQDRFPVRFYAGFDTTGNDNTGDERWFAGFNWEDAFEQFGHVLNYQFTTSSDVNMLRAHSANYAIPFSWKHRLRLYGSYTHTDSELTVPLNSNGYSWQTSVRYEMPFEPVPIVSTGEAVFHHQLTAGFDFKQTNNNLEFGGTMVNNATTDVVQWMLGYDTTITDPCGSTSIGGKIFVAPGDLTSNSKDQDYQDSRARSDSTYTYAKVNIQRTTNLPADWQVHNQFNFQWSNRKLLSSEQLFIGGMHTVRGYDESEASGDEGWYVRNELRTPPVSFAELFGIQDDIQDELVFHGFWDYGSVGDHEPLASMGDNDNTELCSVGAGARYQLDDYLSANVDYGFQLIDVGNARHDSRLHLSLTVSY